MGGVDDERWMHCFRLTELELESVGNPNVPKRYRSSDGTNLGDWQSHQRRLYKERRLRPDRRAMLGRLEQWRWRYRGGMNHLYLDAFKAYVATHGHGQVPADYVALDGLGLGRWLANLRQAVNGTGQKRDAPEWVLRELTEIDSNWATPRRQRPAVPRRRFAPVIETDPPRALAALSISQRKVLAGLHALVGDEDLVTTAQDVAFELDWTTKDSEPESTRVGAKLSGMRRKGLVDHDRPPGNGWGMKTLWRLTAFGREVAPLIDSYRNDAGIVHLVEGDDEADAGMWWTR